MQYQEVRVYRTQAGKHIVCRRNLKNGKLPVKHLLIPEGTPLEEANKRLEEFLTQDGLLGKLE